ncbi:MAG: L,D-transpeptidase family protein [Candidatus Adlerbacteria bacterium]|nr:L,D-transpeptidase family protein [Candidatus Adlerbacteria bacterium]
MSFFIRHRHVVIAATGFAVLLAALFLFVYIQNNSHVAGIVPGGGQTATTTSLTGALQPPLFEYLEVVDGCGPYYNTGVCVNMRSGPGTKYPAVARLRTGVVLRVEKEITIDGRVWDKIKFDNEVKYPDRLPPDLYVAAEFVRNFYDDGNHLLVKGSAPTTKRIVVDVGKEMLYAYDGDTLFMQEPVSTGLELTPTARGTFTVFKMTPARYMQGPLPGTSDQVYDLPGVPWNLYFTKDGAVIHGAYWHDHFGEPWSHGCVNLPPQSAKKLYDWAVVGTQVIVKD